MGSLAVYEHGMVRYRRTWRGSIFSYFVIPLLFFFGIGMGVGTYVNRAGTLPVDYLTYLAPGLLASSALQIAIGEATFPVFGAFKWGREYHAMAATPLRVAEIIAGQLAFVVTRVLLASSAYLLAMTVFGTVRTPWALAMLPVAALLGVAVAAPTFAYSARARTDSAFSLLFRFAVIPATLFSGVFFPVAQLPVGLRPLAYASPLWHAVVLCRSATFAQAPFWPTVGHVAYLAAWAVAGFELARRAFHAKLDR